MKSKTLALVAVFMMAAVSVQAQKIKVVDTEGDPIPLVSVLTENGIFIGTTAVDGTLSDVKGAAKVSVTHVAYKPQLVSVGSLKDGVITMESVDYGLEEIVVKPKPYIYMEYYFRGFSYIGDSLRTYAAGILPVALEIQKNYKGKKRVIYSYGGAANKAVAWNTNLLEIHAEKLVSTAEKSLETLLRKDETFRDHYRLSMDSVGDNRWAVSNPEGEVGYFEHDNGLYHAMLDGGKIQIYADKVNGNEKRQKARERRNYDYQYSEVFMLDEDGLVQPYNKVMEMSHWEYDSSKGRQIIIIYIYAVDHSYMDDDEFKARSKELNRQWMCDMSLDDMEEYERNNNIPPLAPTQQKAIRELKKQRGKTDKNEKEEE